VTSKSSTTREPQPSQSSSNNVRATVTGVDSGGQLFRDNARILFLKGLKCIYHSKIKPASDNSVLIEIRIDEPWRSNAKVKAVSPAGSGQEGFRVTLELDRAHSAVIEVAEGDADPQPKTAMPPNRPPSAADAVPRDTKPGIDAPVEPPEAPGPDFRPVSVPASESADVVADLVQSILALELEQLKFELKDVVTQHVDAASRESLAKIEAWKQEWQAGVASQVNAALHQPLAGIEARLGQIQTQPALSEASVHKIAAKAAENAQIEWATTSQKIVADALRSAMASESEQQRRELRTLVSGEIETAWKGPLAARIDAKIDKVVDGKMEEHSRNRPSLTEDVVRRLAAQVAEGIQLQWASTKLQKIVTEAARAAVATDNPQRRAEITAVVSGEIEAAMDAMLARKIEQYFQTPLRSGALQQWVAEAVRQPLEAEYEQRARQVQAVVTSEIQASVRGPIAAQMDEMLKRALDAQRAEYLRTPPPITEDTIRQITAGIAQHPALQESIDALASTLSDRWMEISHGATASAHHDLSSRIAATERLADQVVVDVQQRLDSFSVEMNRILGAKEAGSPGEGDPQAAALDREQRVREMLQSTGSHFQREMKAVLQKIFGRS
jgi:hypothetical protein